MKTVNKKFLVISMVILTTLSLFGRPGSFNVKKSITYEESQKRVEKVVAWHISTTNAMEWVVGNRPLGKRYKKMGNDARLVIAEIEAERMILRMNNNLDSDSRKRLYQVLKKRGYCFIGDLSLSGRTEIHCPHCRAVETLKLETLQEKGQGSEAP